MTTGRELDAEIAEKVFGLVKCRADSHNPGGNAEGWVCYADPASPDAGGECHQYSTDIGAAMEAAQKTCELLGPRVRLHLEVGDSYACAKFVEHHVGYGGTKEFAYHEDENGDAALAICEAALKALGAAKGGRE